MKKIKIQDRNNQKLEYEENFSVLKQNKLLNKNESNKRHISCINSFSSLKFGIIFYTIFCASFIVLLVGAIGLSNNSKNNDLYKNNNFVKYPAMVGVGAGIFAIVFFLTLVRVISSPITQSLKEFRKDISQPLDEYIEGIKQSTIELYAKCECYHTTSTTTTHSDGSTSTTTSTVVTYREDIQIPILNSKDITNSLVYDYLNNYLGNNSNSKKYLQISFYRYWFPFDNSSEQAIKTYLDYLTEKNEKKDTSFSLVLELNYVDKKFKEHLLFPIKSFNNNIGMIEKGPSDSIIVDKPPVLFRYGFYILSIFLFLFLPYEIYFNSKVYKSKFKFVKLVQVSTPCEEYLNSDIYNNINNNNTYYQSNNYQLLNDQSSSSSLPLPPPQQYQQKEKSIILDKESDDQQNQNQNQNQDDSKDKSINNIDK